MPVLVDVVLPREEMLKKKPRRKAGLCIRVSLPLALACSSFPGNSEVGVLGEWLVHIAWTEE